MSCVALVVALAVAGVMPGSQATALEQARSFRCDFPTGVFREVDAKAVGKNADAGGLRDIVFTAIDRGQGSATMVGNFGTEQVAVVIGPEALSFVETTASGSIIATTLFKATYHESREGPVVMEAFRAVMSRHIARTGRGAMVSSLDGVCRALIN